MCVCTALYPYSSIRGWLVSLDRSSHHICLELSRESYQMQTCIIFSFWSDTHILQYTKRVERGNRNLVSSFAEQFFYDYFRYTHKVWQMQSLCRFAFRFLLLCMWCSMCVCVFLTTFLSFSVFCDFFVRRENYTSTSLHCFSVSLFAVCVCWCICLCNLSASRDIWLPFFYAHTHI